MYIIRISQMTEILLCDTRAHASTDRSALLERLYNCFHRFVPLIPYRFTFKLEIILLALITWFGIHRHSLIQFHLQFALVTSVDSSGSRRAVATLGAVSAVIVQACLREPHRHRHRDGKAPGASLSI